MVANLEVKKEKRSPYFNWELATQPEKVILV
jgi:hypothetical protein